MKVFFMITKIEKDVLVIGTGGAGVRAAIEAAAHGVSVVAVSKAPAGVNNATAMVGMWMPPAPEAVLVGQRLYN